MMTFKEWLGNIKVCERTIAMDHPFAIVTSYRQFNPDGTRRTTLDNVSSNRELRSRLKERGMVVQPLVGRWRECRDTSLPYERCPQDQLVDSLERSYLVRKPEEMDLAEFRNIIAGLSAWFNQDAFILGDGTQVRAVFRDGGEQVVGSGSSLGGIGQAYGRHVLKMDAPFKFEGVQTFRDRFEEEEPDDEDEDEDE
mgnify:CR=1 FL=1